ncbi:MAG TPA: DNA gyrase subunit A [Vicinamibacterales bacterium]|nr:DNA gyrase subunit A [Vicinamibacterales bacterium]
MSTEQRIPVNIEDEMRRSYLDYAMSVIIGRALPDVRDGLKPAHRRVLYAMRQMGLASNRAYRKCAKVVGEVIGNYHPHGDVPAYDTLVRLAQDFNMRYTLVDGQGNFGSIDGDSPAAYRYTEARLEALAESMMADLDKDTVDVVPNFDETTTEPTVLPTPFPNLLVNGSTGIAVGMATNVPPHNLREVCEGVVWFIENAIEVRAPQTAGAAEPAGADAEGAAKAVPDHRLSKEQKLRGLIERIPGPDFPTGGLIVGRSGIHEAYLTGRGSVQMRAKVEIEAQKRGDRQQIVIHEIPYQVNKAKLQERIADLVRDKIIEGISDIRDESDRDGMRVVIELKRGEVPDVVLNNLYKHTQLQQNFGIIMLAIVGGRPKVLTLLEVVEEFVEFRREVVRRRVEFELRKAEARAHILEGLRIALDNLDAVITLIRSARNPPEAKTGLITQFGLSDVQSQAILDMQLQRLTGLERKKILDELADLVTLIASLREILASEKLSLEIIVRELRDVQARFGDARRTEILDQGGELSIEDLIADEDVAITVTDTGYIKRTPISTYRNQRRGGKGRIGMRTRDEDVVNHLFVASTHSYVMVFSDRGRAYWLKVHEIPDVGPDGRGKAIPNLVQLEAGEKIAAMLPVREFDAAHFVVMGTRHGTIKKTELSAFSNPRVGGIIAMGIDENDAVISVRLSDGESEVFIGTRQGMAIRFHESDVRSMGRTAYGVRGIQLREGDEVVGLEVVKPGGTLLTVTQKGYAKRTLLDEYRVQSRGGLGLKNLEITDKNGLVVGIAQAQEIEELLVITQQGKILRTPASQIRTIGRATQGVRVMDLDDDDSVVSVALVEREEELVASAPDPSTPARVAPSEAEGQEE